MILLSIVTTTTSIKGQLPINLNSNHRYRRTDLQIQGCRYCRIGRAAFEIRSILFFDYVVVEGSLDGINWTPLFDGYDSSLNPSWRTAYNNEQSGNSSLYVEQESNLLDVFDLDDIIFIRYRLFADPFVNGWGWAIDNVAVELDNTTPVLMYRLRNWPFTLILLMTFYS